MMIKKSKLIDVAEGLARKLYGLSPNYEVSTYSAKKSAFDLTMSNGLITLKISFPVSLLEDNAKLGDNNELEEHTNNVDEGEQDNGKEQKQEQEQKESKESKETGEKDGEGKQSRKRKKLNRNKK